MSNPSVDLDNIFSLLLLRLQDFQVNTAPDPTAMYHGLMSLRTTGSKATKQERKWVQWEASAPSLQEQAGQVDPVAQVSCPAVTVSFLHQENSGNSSLLASTAFCQCHNSWWQLSAGELLLTWLHFTKLQQCPDYICQPLPHHGKGSTGEFCIWGALPPFLIPCSLYSFLHVWWGRAWASFVWLSGVPTALIVILIMNPTTRKDWQDTPPPHFPRIILSF